MIEINNKYHQQIVFSRSLFKPDRLVFQASFETLAVTDKQEEFIDLIEGEFEKLKQADEKIKLLEKKDKRSTEEENNLNEEREKAKKAMEDITKAVKSQKKSKNIFKALRKIFERGDKPETNKFNDFERLLFHMRELIKEDKHDKYLLMSKREEFLSKYNFLKLNEKLFEQGHGVGYNIKYLKVRAEIDGKEVQVGKMHIAGSKPEGDVIFDKFARGILSGGKRNNLDAFRKKLVEKYGKKITFYEKTIPPTKQIQDLSDNPGKNQEDYQKEKKSYDRQKEIREDLKIEKPEPFELPKSGEDMTTKTLLNGGAKEFEDPLKEINKQGGILLEVISWEQFHRDLKRLGKTTDDIVKVEHPGYKKDRTEIVKNNIKKLWVKDIVTLKSDVADSGERIPEAERQLFGLQEANHRTTQQRFSRSEFGGKLEKSSLSKYEKARIRATFVLDSVRTEEVPHSNSYKRFEQLSQKSQKVTGKTLEQHFGEVIGASDLSWENLWSEEELEKSGDRNDRKELIKKFVMQPGVKAFMANGDVLNHSSGDFRFYVEQMDANLLSPGLDTDEEIRGKKEEKRIASVEDPNQQDKILEKFMKIEENKIVYGRFAEEFCSMSDGSTDYRKLSKYFSFHMMMFSNCENPVLLVVPDLVKMITQLKQTPPARPGDYQAGILVLYKDLVRFGSVVRTNPKNPAGWNCAVYKRVNGKTVGIDQKDDLAEAQKRGKPELAEWTKKDLKKVLGKNWQSEIKTGSSLEKEVQRLLKITQDLRNGDATLEKDFENWETLRNSKVDARRLAEYMDNKGLDNFAQLHERLKNDKDACVLFRYMEQWTSSKAYEQDAGIVFDLNKDDKVRIGSSKEKAKVLKILQRLKKGDKLKSGIEGQKLGEVIKEALNDLKTTSGKPTPIGDVYRIPVTKKGHSTVWRMKTGAEHHINTTAPISYLTDAVVSVFSRWIQLNFGTSSMPGLNKILKRLAGKEGKDGLTKAMKTGKLKEFFVESGMDEREAKQIFHSFVKFIDTGALDKGGLAVARPVNENRWVFIFLKGWLKGKVSTIPGQGKGEVGDL